MEVRKIYYRFFDIDWNGDLKTAVPVSPLAIYNYDANAELVPVVFITNETFKNLDLNKSKDLARQVHKRVMYQLSSLMVRSTWGLYDEDDWSSQESPFRMKSKNFDEQRRYDSLYNARLKTVKEVQFDCDWTNTTKEKYFAFLNEAKTLFKDLTVTSTLRLYQYKYPKEADTPPVSRAMLMCYNAGDVRKPETVNSIFTKDEVMSYLEDVDEYPIPLDYALPVFSWALVYQEGQLKHILSSVTLEQDYGSYLEATDADHFKVREDFVYGYTASSVYLRAGDEVRIERPDMNDVTEVAGWLNDNKNNDQAIVTLYHLNEYDLKTHAEAIRTIFDTF